VLPVATDVVVDDPRLDEVVRRQQPGPADGDTTFLGSTGNTTVSR